MFEKLHKNVKVRVNVNDVLSEPVSVDNGIKQGDIPAPAPGFELAYRESRFAVRFSTFASRIAVRKISQREIF